MSQFQTGTQTSAVGPAVRGELVWLYLPYLPYLFRGHSRWFSASFLLSTAG